MTLPVFVAIDFETADYGADSACAVGLVRVEGDQITRREARLIRPPRSRFAFTHIHGISWRDVAEQGSFATVWAELEPVLEGAQFLAAHNAGFDRSVLRACCASAGMSPPALEFVCSMRLARKEWNLYPTKLPDVCRFLGIGLKHHDAASDAEACARIVLAALQDQEERARRQPTPDSHPFDGLREPPARDGGRVARPRA